MKSTLCHSISKKTFCTIWWRLHDKNETIFTIRCRQESFVTKISFKCVWYISIGHSVSIKASVWLRHSIHSSISHFHKGKLVWGEISCFYHACMFHMFHIFLQILAIVLVLRLFIYLYCVVFMGSGMTMCHVTVRDPY